MERYFHQGLLNDAGPSNDTGPLNNTQLLTIQNSRSPGPLIEIPSPQTCRNLSADRRPHSYLEDCGTSPSPELAASELQRVFARYLRYVPFTTTYDSRLSLLFLMRTNEASVCIVPSAYAPDAKYRLSVDPAFWTTKCCAESLAARGSRWQHGTERGGWETGWESLTGSPGRISPS